MMDKLPLSRVYRFIEPGPVVLVTTVPKKERPNIMTMSYHMVMDDGVPPLIGCMIGPWDHSFGALCSTGECVIAVPTVDLATTVVEIGNCSGADIDKFETFSLTPVPAKKIKPPLVAECLANFECRVKDDSIVERYNMFVMEVVEAWVDPGRKERRVIHHRGDGTFVVDGRILNLKKKMVKWPTYVQ
jgi:flavin reductase (DIM6/NTAB) family NADH-FMN oxidoreductase RutF